MAIVRCDPDELRDGFVKFAIRAAAAQCPSAASAAPRSRFFSTSRWTTGARRARLLFVTKSCAPRFIMATATSSPTAPDTTMKGMSRPRTKGHRGRTRHRTQAAGNQTRLRPTTLELTRSASRRRSRLVYSQADIRRVPNSVAREQHRSRNPPICRTDRCSVQIGPIRRTGQPTRGRIGYAKLVPVSLCTFGGG